MKKIIIQLFVLLPLSFASGQYINYRLYPSTPGVHQIEPAIVRHPTNPQVMFASAFTIYTSFRSEWIYVSTDGGQSWRGSDTINGAPISGHGGDPGPVIDK